MALSRVAPGFNTGSSSAAAAGSRSENPPHLSDFDRARPPGHCVSSFPTDGNDFNFILSRSSFDLKTTKSRAKNKTSNPEKKIFFIPNCAEWNKQSEKIVRHNTSFGLQVSQSETSDHVEQNYFETRYIIHHHNMLTCVGLKIKYIKKKFDCQILAWKSQTSTDRTGFRFVINSHELSARYE